MFSSTTYQGRIVHRDSECIIFDIYQKPPNNNVCLGQLVFCVKNNSFSYSIYGSHDTLKLQKELMDGLESLMEQDWFKHLYINK